MFITDQGVSSRVIPARKPDKSLPASRQAIHEKAPKTNGDGDQLTLRFSGTPATPQFGANWKKPGPKQKLAMLILALITGTGGVVTTFNRAQSVTGSGNNVCATVNNNPQYGGSISPEQRVTNLINMGTAAWGNGRDLQRVDWNAVYVMLGISDDTVQQVPRFLEIQPIRRGILEAAFNHPSEVPLYVLQEAIYTSGILGRNTTDAALKAQITDSLLPFTNHVLLVIPSNDPNRDPEMRFVTPEEAEDYKKDHYQAVIVDIGPYARAALARTGDTRAAALLSTDLQTALDEMRAAGTNYTAAAEAKQTAIMTLEILGELPEGQSIGQAANIALSLVFTNPNASSPQLVDLENSQQRELAAAAINLLAKRGHPKAETAIRQWYQNYDSSFSTNTSDLLMVEALALHVQRNPEDYNFLKQVMATHGSAIGEALYGVFSSTSMYEIGPLRNAHKALVPVLEAHRDDIRAYVVDLLEGRAPMIPNAEMNQDSARRAARTLALFMMASDSTGQYADYLRGIARRDEPGRPIAIAGLGNHRDEASIETLMEIAVGPGEATRDERATAMEAVLRIIGPSRIPLEHLEQAQQQSMFSPAFLEEFFGGYMSRMSPDGELILPEGHMNWSTRVNEKLARWVENENAARQATRDRGGVAPEVTAEEITEQLHAIIQAEVPDVDNAQFRQLAADPDFTRNYLMPMISYLTTSKRAMDLNLAYPMMALLQASGSPLAAEVFADIATNPEEYGPDLSRMFMDGPMLQAELPEILKIDSLEALGATASPSSPLTDLLHLAQMDPSLPIQRAALTGLLYLGQRMNDGSPVSDTDRAAMQGHINRIFQDMERTEQGFTTKHQSRRVQDVLRYEFALAIDALGGRDQLLQLANREWQANPLSPVARSYVHAMMAHGLTPEAAQQKGYDPNLVNYFAEEAYWLGELNTLCDNVQGGQHANFDVGFAHNGFDGPYQYPYNQPMRLVYPADMEYGKTENWEEVHSSATASLVSRIANNPQILTFHVNGDVEYDPWRGDAHQDAFLAYIEQLVQEQAEGETNVITANYSIGYKNLIYYLQGYREQMADVISAYMQALGQTGVTNVVSAGNAQGGTFDQRFDPIGEQNGLGSRVNNQMEVTKPNSTLLIAAVDGLSRWLAEFSSMPNPLRLEEALEMFGAPGYRVPLAAYGEADGTSFSAPNISGIIHREGMIRAALGLPPLTAEQRRLALINASQPLPNRQPWETGRYVDPVAYFREIIKPVPTEPQSQEDRNRLTRINQWVAGH